MAEVELIIFWVTNQKFGIETSMVEKIQKGGMFMEEGLELIDTVCLFNLKSISDKKKILKLQIQGKKVGILVDDVSKVLEIEDIQIKPFPSFLKSEYLSAVGEIENDLILLLDIEKVVKQRSNSKYLIKPFSQEKKKPKLK